jgi:hypothetical protein
VTDDSAERAGPWRPWTIGVPGLVAFLGCILLLVGDGLAGVMASWDSPQPCRGWLQVAAVGHGVLAAASLALLGAGLARASFRRTAAIAAWAIIPVGVGWFLLCGRLAAGA